MMRYLRILLTLTVAYQSIYSQDTTTHNDRSPQNGRVIAMLRLITLLMGFLVFASPKTEASGRELRVLGVPAKIVKLPCAVSKALLVEIYVDDAEQGKGIYDAADDVAASLVPAAVAVCSDARRALLLVRDHSDRLLFALSVSTNVGATPQLIRPALPDGLPNWLREKPPATSEEWQLLSFPVLVEPFGIVQYRVPYQCRKDLTFAVDVTDRDALINFLRSPDSTLLKLASIGIDSRCSQPLAFLELFVTSTTTPPTRLKLTHAIDKGLVDVQLFTRGNGDIEQLMMPLWKRVTDARDAERIKRMTSASPQFADFRVPECDGRVQEPRSRAVPTARDICEAVMAQGRFTGSPPDPNDLDCNPLPARDGESRVVVCHYFDRFLGLNGRRTTRWDFTLTRFVFDAGQRRWEVAREAVEREERSIKNQRERSEEQFRRYRDAHSRWQRCVDERGSRLCGNEPFPNDPQFIAP